MIQGVQVVPLKAHMDDRGYLIEVARSATGYGQTFSPKPDLSAG